MTGASGVKSTARAIVRFVVGPWPMFPWIVFGALFLLIVLQNMQVSLLGATSQCRYSCVTMPRAVIPLIGRPESGVVVNDVDLVIILGNALATAVVVAVALGVGSRLVRKDASGVPSRPAYLGVLALAAVLGGVARVLVLSPAFLATPSLSPAGVLPTSLRTFVSITVVQSLCGMLIARYQGQVAAATEAMELVRAQQRLVVEADERAKRQVAELLHDRVQADLLVVAMEVRAAIEDCDAQDGRERLERVVTDLERIRTNEVRSASRRLSPAVGTVGLDTALDELAESWASAVRVRITFDSASRALLMGPSSPRALVTAVYRVTEQALLNAVSHGSAARVEVSLAMPSASELDLMVSDDGKGLPPIGITRGSGAAIVDAWCETAHGSWELVPGQTIGAVLRARFALA